MVALTEPAFAQVAETSDKDLAIQATQRWIETSLERAKIINSAQCCN